MNEWGVVFRQTEIHWIRPCQILDHWEYPQRFFLCRPAVSTRCMVWYFPFRLVQRMRTQHLCDSYYLKWTRTRSPSIKLRSSSLKATSTHDWAALFICPLVLGNSLLCGYACEHLPPRFVQKNIEPSHMLLVSFAGSRSKAGAAEYNSALDVSNTFKHCSMVWRKYSDRDKLWAIIP